LDEALVGENVEEDGATEDSGPGGHTAEPVLEHGVCKRRAADGRLIRIVTVVDQSMRECVALSVERSPYERRIVAGISAVFATRQPTSA
jgi:hypothetical protein